MRLFCGLCLLITLPLAAQDVLDGTLLFGNTRTRDRIVLRELALKPGLPLTGNALSNDKGWLLRLNCFKRVELETRPSALPGHRVLMLTVQDKNPWSFDPILSQYEPFGWIAGGRMGYNNLFGRRAATSLLVQLGAVNHFAWTWREPWFLGRFRFFAETEIHHRQFRYEYGDHPVAFFEKDWESRFTIGKNWGRLFQTGYSVAWETIEASDPEATLSGQWRDRFLSLGPFVQWDSRDWPAYPFSGVFLRLWHAQNRLSDSGKHFDRTGFDARFFCRAFGRNILAFQTAGQISNGMVPVVRRLHIGGGKTLRGIENGSISGESAATATVEYRMPILFEEDQESGFRFGYAAVAFADLGAAWYQTESLCRDMLRGSVGFGFHGIVGGLVLRLEWGTRGNGPGFISTGTGVKF